MIAHPLMGSSRAVQVRKLTGQFEPNGAGNLGFVHGRGCPGTACLKAEDLITSQNDLGDSNLPLALAIPAA